MYRYNSPGRFAHSLRKPGENVAAAGIRPLAEGGFSWGDAATVQPKAELLQEKGRVTIDFFYF